MQDLGRNWLWIRGLTRGQAHWGDSEEIWRQQHPNDRILHIEIPGCGRRFEETSAMSISENVSRMRSELEKQKNELNFKGPLHVLSVSLGGMIAAEWLTQFPEDFATATIINSSSSGLSFPWQRCLPEAWATLAVAARIEEPYKREQKILSLLTNETPRLKLYIEQFALEATNHPVRKLNAVIQLIAAANFKWPQLKPKIPVLILAAQKDRMVSVECSKKIAEFWDVPIEIHPTAGHELTLDDTSWVIQKVDEFLQRS